MPRVNWRAGVSRTGTVVRWLAVPMLFPVALALYFEATSAVAATLGNVGPGIDIVGPMNNFDDFPRSRNC